MTSITFTVEKFSGKTYFALKSPIRTPYPPNRQLKNALFFSCLQPDLNLIFVGSKIKVTRSSIETNYQIATSGHDRESNLRGDYFYNCENSTERYVEFISTQNFNPGDTITFDLANQPSEKKINDTYFNITSDSGPISPADLQSIVDYIFLERFLLRQLAFKPFNLFFYDLPT